MTDPRQPRDIEEAQAAIDAGLIFVRARNGTVQQAKVWQDTAGDWWPTYLIPADFGEAS
jgi:hypothetical protein